jgi:hypothetical protein
MATPELKALIASMEALTAAEKFAESMLPLLKAANDMGGIDAAITILKAAASESARRRL